MSMISELLDDLEEMAYWDELTDKPKAKIINEAIDTIKILSEKLRAANMERSNQYYKGGYRMKVYNLPRGAGKTTRMIYASEASGATILCSTNAGKEYIKDLAKSLYLVIPEPITVDEYLRGDGKSRNILVDDALLVLSNLIGRLSHSEIIACTLTTDDEAQI